MLKTLYISIDQRLNIYDINMMLKLIYDNKVKYDKAIDLKNN